uniref:Thioredoxin domain-containing protein n=1 Tax=Zooxanthella nutricula TaxID=1333877 RepID=A0A6V0FXP4_9DINO|mmetsp:Transcript_59684/g.182295  ORF Transcript_59684/g.182295 Transcript_59684/m.182295 type:complete len:191 (+) Transcript_59684:81-653(+)
MQFGLVLRVALAGLLALAGGGEAFKGLRSSRTTSPWGCALEALPDAPLPALAFSHQVSHARARGVDAVQAVVEVDSNGLVQRMAVQNVTHEAYLVTFFAPWCPHCVDFVMQDAHGNASNAPLEILSRQLIEANGPTALKFDVAFSTPPSDFDVQFVPTIVHINEFGAIDYFQGDRHDVASLFDWAMCFTI